MKRQLQELMICFQTEYAKSEFQLIAASLQEEGCQISFWTRKAMKKQIATLQSKYLVVTDDTDLADYLYDRKYPVLLFILPNQSGFGSKVMYGIEGFQEVSFSYFDQVYCRLQGIPWTVLETERLLIREITVQDVDRLYELYAEPSITKYMENLYTKREQEYEYTKEYIRNVYGFYGYGIWIVIEKKSGKIIGRAGLENKEGFEGLELGFMIGVPFQNKGYAYEACEAILQYGREELEIFDYQAFVMKDNMVSIKLLTKLGFSFLDEKKENKLTYDHYTAQYR